MSFKNYFICSFLAILNLLSCKQKTNDKTETISINHVAEQIKKFGMVTELKYEKAEYYKQLHAAAWPAVQKKISDCNIQNYSIFLKEIDGRLLLFSYFEYAGNDFDADMKKMAADTATQRWWKETDPCQQPLPDAVSKKQIWSNMEEVFHEK